MHKNIRTESGKTLNALYNQYKEFKSVLEEGPKNSENSLDDIASDVLQRMKYAEMSIQNLYTSQQNTNNLLTGVIVVIAIAIITVVIQLFMLPGYARDYTVAVKENEKILEVQNQKIKFLEEVIKEFKTIKIGVETK